MAVRITVSHGPAGSSANTENFSVDGFGRLSFRTYGPGQKPGYEIPGEPVPLGDLRFVIWILRRAGVPVPAELAALDSFHRGPKRIEDGKEAVYASIISLVETLPPASEASS